MDNWKKEIWTNWKQEIKSNLWLVKERHQEAADNGEKVGEIHQEKEVIDLEKVKKLIDQEKKDRERRWQEE